MRRGLVDRTLEHATRGSVLAAVTIRITDRHSSCSSCRGLPSNSLLMRCSIGVEHGDIGRLGLGAGVRVGGADQAEHEGIECRGTLRLSARFIALPQGHAEANAERGHDRHW